MKYWPVLLYLIVVLSVGTWAAAQIPGGGGGSGGGGGGNVSGSGTIGQCATWVGPNSIGATGSACGSGGGSGTITSGNVGDVPKYTGTTTLGDTGVVWPPRLDQLQPPMQGDYDAGGFFTILHNGTYYQIGAPIVFGSQNEQLQGLAVPRVVSSNGCISENLGSATVVATPTSDAGGRYITLSPALTGVPDTTVTITDSTSGQISAVIQPTASSTAANSTTKLYFASTSGISANDRVVTGTSMICTTPSGVLPYEGIIVGGALDQTETYTLPLNWVNAPFTPSVVQGRSVGAFFFGNTSAALASYTFSWNTPANGSFLISRVGNANLSAPFENTSGLISVGSGTSAGLGGLVNNNTTDLFLTFLTQNTGATLSLPTAPTQGKGIIEDVLYNGAKATPQATNIPAAACDNVDQNDFGYVPPYNNVLFTDPQWGGTYQRMIRNGVGGNVDHNFYYSRNSWNSNHTLMLGIQTPPSADGTGNPWIMALYDQNGCFLKPLFYITGAPTGSPSFNWRVNWSKTDPNIFYTGGSGTSGTWPGINPPNNTLNSNTLYAIHPCASSITGSSDSACSSNQTLQVTSLFTFTPSLTTGANYISTNQPAGPSVSEDGTHIGIMTRPAGSSSGDYYVSALTFTSSTTVNPSSLTTFDASTIPPTTSNGAQFCLSTGGVEVNHYIGNGTLWSLDEREGTGTPSCSPTQVDAGFQFVDTATGLQAGFIGQSVNAPWFNSGGHSTFSPHIGSVGGGGYFVYSHNDGATSIPLTGCTAVANVATCTAATHFPIWPIGTTIVTKGISLTAYNGSFPTTTTGGTTSISFTIASTPAAGTGGTMGDGNQWEMHTISIDGTTDVTNYEASNLLAGQTNHAYWPWGSPANGGVVTDYYYAGTAYNSVSQYPTQVVTGCTYTGSAPTGTAVCTLANNLPSTWITPTNQTRGSLGASTPYVFGVSDGSTQCYNGTFVITASTSNTFSYQPRCTPAGAGGAGGAYVGLTDEIWQCYVGDAVNGNYCVPVARTYSAQVSSDFYFEPLPNGSQEGDFVEFDSAPGVVPVNGFGKVGDAKTLLPGTTPPFNATEFYTYAAISPQGTFQSTGSGAWAGVTVALQAAPGVAPIATYAGNGSFSAQGSQVQNVSPPLAVGDAEAEGNPIGAIAPTTLINGCKGDVTLSSGTGTFTNACVTTASACWSTDITTPSNGCTVAAPGAGSVGITGTGTDVCRTVCQ